ncbi:hypothetical protein GCM10011297_14720 [Bacterioplanes sanyensis]|uniref:hypothetical protein n=1 Tax=Bacterioplanes sanyensis TaxID=1249553 RepID=UPI00198C76E3|nr:hypothetical protein [Bacterioplanes sanyensis]GGY42754.1 hypothetical protein GCM10011297_14720 [Bacterioplanes sanyensis]
MKTPRLLLTQLLQLTALILLVAISGCQRLPSQPNTAAQPDPAIQQPAAQPSTSDMKQRSKAKQHPSVGSRYTAPELLLVLHDTHSNERTLQPISRRARMLSHTQSAIQVVGVLPVGTELEVIEAKRDAQHVLVRHQDQLIPLQGVRVSDTEVQWLVTSDECTQLSHCQPWQQQIQRCLAKSHCQTFVQFIPTDGNGSAHPGHRPPFKPEWIKATLAPARQYATRSALQLDVDPVMLEAIATGSAVEVAQLFFHQRHFHLKGDVVYAAD